LGEQLKGAVPAPFLHSQGNFSPAHSHKSFEQKGQRWHWPQACKHYWSGSSGQNSPTQNIIIKAGTVGNQCESKLSLVFFSCCSIVISNFPTAHHHIPWHPSALATNIS